MDIEKYRGWISERAQMLERTPTTHTEPALLAIIDSDVRLVVDALNDLISIVLDRIEETTKLQ